MTGSKLCNLKNHCGYFYAMTEEAWTWEFIRRDPTYKKKWAQHKSRKVISPMPSVYPLDGHPTHNVAKDKTKNKQPGSKPK